MDVVCVGARVSNWPGSQTNCYRYRHLPGAPQRATLQPLQSGLRWLGHAGFHRHVHPDNKHLIWEKYRCEKILNDCKFGRHKWSEAHEGCLQKEAMTVAEGSAEWRWRSVSQTLRVWRGIRMQLETQPTNTNLCRGSRPGGPREECRLRSE